MSIKNLSNKYKGHLDKFQNEVLINYVVCSPNNNFENNPMKQVIDRQHCAQINSSFLPLGIQSTREIHAL